MSWIFSVFDTKSHVVEKGGSRSWVFFRRKIEKSVCFTSFEIPRIGVGGFDDLDEQHIKPSKLLNITWLQT